MNRRHLRYQDRIILAHFFGKFHLFNVGRNDLRFDILFVPDAHGGDQGTDADSCCSQVVDLIDSSVPCRFVRNWKEWSLTVGR